MSIIVPMNKMEKRGQRKRKSELSDTNMKIYTIPDERPTSINILKRAEVLLPFKQYSKLQGVDRFKRNLGMSIYDKYKIISAELKKRLYVNDSAINIYAATDVDEDYYNHVDGRPLRLHIPVFKTFKISVNKMLQVKQEAGIKKDCVLNIDANYRNEFDIYELSAKRLIYQAKCFDTFISEDYKKSMHILAKWDRLQNLIDSKIKELQHLAIEKFTIQSRLIGLEYRFGLQQKYGRFLYYLSPPLWRLNNRKFARSIEIEARGFDFGNSSEEDTFIVIFEKLRRICYETPIKPVLYFTQPTHLMDVFDSMENQQLHYYTHINHLTPHAKMLKERIKSLKENINQEYAIVSGSIRRFEKLLQLSESRCTQLEAKFYKVLYGLFYESVGSPKVLKLITHLEFAFEKLYFEKPMNMDLIAIANCLEHFYFEHSKKLDAIQSETVRRAMYNCLQREKNKVKRAKHAAKELHSFHRLKKLLLKAHGIVTDEVYVPLKKNYEKKNILRPEIKQRVRVKTIDTLSEAQIEYLTLFTEWTETEDPTIYLQSINLDQRNE